ncbi:MAG TPA: PEPxxWA-CTERM sorting domain-containing protein [Sphingomonas sp.]|jgi:hypothetical protein|uniref:PEPxxWA-CTERM sorting domain-containing protein n=1 Tax=Sphingomonas sp. TaxID=28214 RepID=UPI002EDA8B80
MKTRLRLLAMSAVAAATLLAGSASAATITYTVSGNFRGTLAGQSFNTPAVFTGIGDTNTTQTLLNTTVVPLSSLTALSGGKTFDFGNAFSFYSTGFIAGFAGGAHAQNLFSFLGALGDATDDTAATPAAFLLGTVNGAVATNLGNVRITQGRNLSYTSTLSAVSGVPEPTTWAMMLVGFGVMGAAARRRARIATPAYA